MASTSTSLLPSPAISGRMTTSPASSSTASRTRPPIPAFQHQQPPASSSFKGPSASLPSSSASSSTSSIISAKPHTALRASRITYAPPSDRMSSVAHTPDPSAKLKRLSLVSRPVSLDLDRDLAKGATGRGAGIGEEERENVPPLSAFSPVSTPSTPRTARRGAGLRSSISYSPAPRHLTFGIEGADGKVDKHEKTERGEKPARSLTLTDKHADLLRLIAQKERKVHEVKQELEAHERALAQLKAKWAAVVSRSAPTPAAAPYISNSMAFPTSTPTPTSASSSSSSLSSAAPPLASAAPSTPSATAAPDGPSAESYMALLQAQTEGLISPATLQGGKRFWGQLVKTVSAAAAGTVPDDPPLDLYACLFKNERRADDRSGLKSMLPAWASPPPAPPERSVPLPPSNRRRLPSDRSHSSKDSPSLQEALVSIDGGDESANGNAEEAEVDLLGDDVLDMSPTSATPSMKEGAAVQPEKDEEGWGW